MTVKERIAKEEAKENAAMLSNQELLEEVKNVVKGMSNFDDRFVNRFYTVSERQMIAKQYSMKNNIKIRGYKFLPKMGNFEFIIATVK